MLSYERIIAVVFALGLLVAGAFGVRAPKAMPRPTRRRSQASPRTPSTIPTARSAPWPQAAIRSPLDVIQALQDGRLLYTGDKVFIRDKAGAILDAATGKPAADAPANPTTVRLNNRLRRSVEAALGGLTLLAADPAKRYEAAQAVFKSRDAACAADARCGARQGNRRAREEGAERGARRGHSLSGKLSRERQAQRRRR